MSPKKIHTKIRPIRKKALRKLIKNVQLKI